MGHADFWRDIIVDGREDLKCSVTRGVCDLEPKDSWDRGQVKVRWSQLLVWGFAVSAGRSWADSGGRNLIYIL